MNTRDYVQTPRRRCLTAREKGLVFIGRVVEGMTIGSLMILLYWVLK